MKMKWLTMVVFTLGAVLVHAEVKTEYLELKPDDASKKAYLAQPYRIWGTKNYKASPETFNALLVLSNSKVKFVFHLLGKLENGIAKNVQIGMLRPSVFNWYAGGFFTVQSGKNKLADGVFSVKEIKSGAESGYAELEYSNSAFNGKIRLELMDNDDKVLLSFTPAGQIPYSINLYAYPGTYGNAKLRDRQVTTNMGVVDGKIKKLTPQDCWAVFSDKYYDKAQNRGDGCCAVLFNPKELLPGSVIRCGYACTSYLYYRKGQTANLIFWDFKGWSAKQAVDYMKKLDVKFE